MYPHFNPKQEEVTGKKTFVNRRTQGKNLRTWTVCNIWKVED